MADDGTFEAGGGMEGLGRRYVDLVYGAAVRQMGGEDRGAEDVTQAVFLLAMRKAKTGKLPEEGRMAGWLLKVTGYAVKEARRAGKRRKRHEEGAAAGRAETLETEVDAEEVKRALDGALLKLGALDREVIVRRYLRGEGVGELAMAVGMTENTASQRIGRALAKLRKMLGRGGVAVPAAGVVGVMMAEGAKGAPAGLGVSVGSAAGVAGGGSAAAVGIAKGAAVMMKVAVVKVGVVVAVCIVVVLGTGVEVAIQAQTKSAGVPRSVTSSQPASAIVNAPGGFKVNLRDGVVSELIAIGDPVSGEWWLADGSPTAGPYAMKDFPLKNAVADTRADRRYLYFVSRANKADGSNVLYGSMQPNDIHYVGVFSRAVGDGGFDRTEVMEVDPNRATTLYHIQIATQMPTSWVHLKVADAAGKPVEELADEKTVAGVGVFRIAGLKEVDGKTQFTATWPETVDLISSEYKAYPAMTDTRGKSVTYSSSAINASDSEKATEHMTTFDIPLSRVAEVGISVIHYDDWVEFRSVSLKAGVKKDVTIATSDDAASAGGTSTTTPTETEEQVIALIKKSGGTVKREGDAPDGAVVGVSFGLSGGAGVTDALVEHFKNLKHLRGLDLNGTKVTDAGLEKIQGMIQLQYLFLRDAQVTDAGSAQIGGLNQLQSLFLNGTQVTDKGLEQLKGLSRLQRLDLSQTHVTDAGLARLAGLKQLRELRLGGTGVTGAGLGNLKPLNLLQVLDLTGDNVTDAGLENVKVLGGLQEFSLAGTKVTDAGLEHLEGMDQLRTLFLMDSGVSEQGVKKLRSALPNCKISY